LFTKYRNENKLGDVTRVRFFFLNIIYHSAAKKTNFSKKVREHARRTRISNRKNIKTDRRKGRGLDWRQTISYFM